MKSKYIFNSYQEYLLFLFIYLANSDFNFHLLETNAILSKMKNLFPPQFDVKDLYNNIKEKYDGLDLEEIEALVEENLPLFKSQLSDTEKLFEDLYDIITSDGIIQDYEIEAFDKIKRLMTSS